MESESWTYINKITHPKRAVLTGSGVSMLLQKYKVFWNNTNLKIDISHKCLHTKEFNCLSTVRFPYRFCKKKGTYA